MSLTIQDVKQALDLQAFDAEAAQRKMMPAARQSRRAPSRPGQVRLGGVLILLYYHGGELYLVLTRRRDNLNAHAGQISFPGGRNDPPEDLTATALRETREEIGVTADTLAVIGRLAPLYIPPSDFEVHPTVAWYQNGKRPYFRASPAEVAEILEVPLHHLLNPATCKEEQWTLRGYEVNVPFFEVQGHKVWGATAMMLSELLERLRALPTVA